MVKRAIQRIRELQQGNEDIVVIGTSMGGIIGKYALLEMEAAGQDTHVSKLFTWDSPLKGANVPLGLQMMIMHLATYKVFASPPLGEIVPILGEAFDALQAPATRELLLVHAPTIVPGLVNPNNDTGNQTYSLTGPFAHPDHTNFFAELAAMGELQQSAYFQLSNGSENAQVGPIVPTSEIVGFDLGTSQVTAMGLFANSDHKGWSEVAGFLLAVVGITSGDFYARGYALPEQHDFGHIYEGRFFTGALNSGFLAVLGQLTGSLLENESRINLMTYNSPLLSYDNLPGGTEALQIDEEGFSVFEPVFSFSPNYSTQNLSPAEAQIQLKDFYAIPTPAPIQARRIAASSINGAGGTENTPHVTLTPKISEVFIDELISPATSHGIGSAATPGPVFNFGTNSRAPGTACFDRFPYVSSSRRLNESVMLGNDEALWVNRQGRIQDPFRPGTNNDPMGCTDPVYYPQNTGDPFTLTLGYDRCTSHPAKVTINNGGELLIGQWSVGYTGQVVVPDGTSIEINDGGKLNVDPHSRLTVKAGGTLIVRAGGELRVGTQAEVVIEPGGRLVVRSGAKFRLNSGQNAYGTACVRIFGVAEWHGKPDFNGNGYFAFMEGNTLVLPNGKFELEGKGEDFRFLEIHALDVGTNDLDLRRGIVQSYGGAKAGAGGRVLLLNTHWYGERALQGTNLDDLSVSYCTFNSMNWVIELSGSSAPPGGIGSPPVRFTHSDFLDCEIGVTAHSIERVQFSACDFLGQDRARTAVEAYDLERLTFGGGRISGYRYYDPPAGNAPQLIHGAVDLLGVEEAWFRNADILENNVGIATINYPEAFNLKSNVFLRQRTRVADNIVGVYVEKGGTDPDGTDWGLVSASCTDIEDNELAGVRGRDVVLEVDAILLGAGPKKPRTNNFNDGDWRLFDICLLDRLDDYPINNYQNLDPTSPNYNPWSYKVQARRNFWGANNGSPLATNDRFLIDDCSRNLGVQLHREYTYPAATRLQTCPLKEVPGPTEPTPKEPEGLAPECNVTVEGELRRVHEQYAAAWDAFEPAGEALPTKELFAPIAALDEEQIEAAQPGEGSPASAYDFVAAKANCRHYREVARTLADANAVVQDARFVDGATLHGLLDPLWVEAARGPAEAAPTRQTAPATRLSPNPAAGRFQLTETLDGPADYRCYDALGRVVATGTFDGRTDIETDQWRPGLYTVELRVPGRAPVALRVVVERP